MAEQRLIDANAIRYEPMLSARGNGQYEDVMVAYKDQIDDLPTIEERKQGKWIREGSAFNLRCPYCRKFFVEPIGSKFNFCPNCGADMRGTKE